MDMLVPWRVSAVLASVWSLVKAAVSQGLGKFLLRDVKGIF